MSKNRKIIYQKYINLLKFDILFALINGMAFAGIAGSNELGMMVILVHFWLFSILIAICHGYVTYTKFKAFFIPHLYFYIAWVASLSLSLFPASRINNLDDFLSIFLLSAIFLSFSCVGALVAKIVMVFKKRFSSSEDEKDAMDENDKNSKISALDFLDSKPSEVIPEREDIIKNNNDSN